MAEHVGLVYDILSPWYQYVVENRDVQEACTLVRERIASTDSMLKDVVLCAQKQNILLDYVVWLHDKMHEFCNSFLYAQGAGEKALCRTEFRYYNDIVQKFFGGIILVSDGVEVYPGGVEYGHQEF